MRSGKKGLGKPARGQRLVREGSALIDGLSLAWTPAPASVRSQRAAARSIARDAHLAVEAAANAIFGGDDYETDDDETHSPITVA